MPPEKKTTPPKKKGFDASYLSKLTKNTAKDIGTNVKETPEEVKEEVQEEVKEAIQQGRLQWIDIALLDANPWQPPDRQETPDDDPDLLALRDSMIEHGFLEEYAIVIRINPEQPESPRRQIAFGHRRVRAAGLAGITKVPYILKTYNDNQMIIFMGIENMAREDFSPMDEAHVLRSHLQMKNEDGSYVYTQASLGGKIKKSRQYVGNRIALLTLPQDLQAMIRRTPDTVRAAMYLAEVPEEEVRIGLIAQVESGELTGERIATAAQMIRNAQRKQREEQIQYEQDMIEHEKANRLQQEEAERQRLAVQRHKDGMEAVTGESKTEDGQEGDDKKWAATQTTLGEIRERSTWGPNVEAREATGSPEIPEQTQIVTPPVRPTPPKPIEQTWSNVDGRQVKSVKELQKALQALFNIKAAEEKSSARMISGDEQDLFESIQNYIEMLKPRFGK